MQSPAATAAVEDLDVFKEGAVEHASFLEIPEFEKMKVLALKQFVLDNIPTEAGEFALKLKKAELIEFLKKTFPHPDALDTPEVTGYDPSDPIMETVTAVQGLESEADAVSYVKGLADTNDFNFFRMGGALAEILSNGWIGDCDDFGAFVHKEFAFGLRKAQNLIAIYHAVVSCGATWDDIKGIGWSKLALVATSLTPENYKQWFEKIKDISYASTMEMVKDINEQGEGAAGPDSVSESTPKKSMTFVVHEDQLVTIRSALDKAKKVGNTEYDGPALEWVCIDYLQGSGGVGPSEGGDAVEGGAMTLGGALYQTIGAADDSMEALSSVIGSVEEAFGTTFPELDIDVYTEGRPEIDDLADDDLDDDE